MQYSYQFRESPFSPNMPRISGERNGIFGNDISYYLLLGYAQDELQLWEIPDTLITRTATRERMNEQGGVSWWSGIMRSRCEWAVSRIVLAEWARACYGRSCCLLLLLLLLLQYWYAVVAVCWCWCWWLMVDGWTAVSSYLLYCPNFIVLLLPK